MARATILIVEDDKAIRLGVRDVLQMGGYAVREAGTGTSGLDIACAGGIDLVLLDILMPEMNGLEMLEALRRARPSLPVIILSALGEGPDRVRGLRLGADDYVVKPFGADELLARVEAVLRRSAERPVARSSLTIAQRTIDLERRQITHADGTRCMLSEREAEVLHYLASCAGRPVSRDELLQRIWGIDPRGVRSRTVDMTIARLREHLRDDPNDPAVIRTIRGRGYMIDAEGES